MPHGKFILHHVSQSKPSKYKNKRLGLFQNNKDIFLNIKSWDTWQHIICSLVHQKSRILVASDNTYMISQRMNAYFVDFFFHPKFVVICD